MTAPREKLATLHELLTAIDGLGDEERLVLLDLAKRLAMGQRSYGDLDLGNDPRDWDDEMRAELLDFLVYSSIKRTQRRLLAK
jgi:hypothetical protein